MNERELSLIKVVGEEFSLILSDMRESFHKELEQQRQVLEEKLSLLSKTIDEIKDSSPLDLNSLLSDAVALLPAPEQPQLPDIASMISEAVATLPPPQDGKSLTPEDIRPMLQSMVDKAISELPTPKNGKDYEPLVLKQEVEEAVGEAMRDIPAPQDGKSLTPEDIQPMLQSMVDKAISELPTPKNGKDYEPLVLKHAVEEAVGEAMRDIPAPQDGKSLTPEDIQPMLQSMVDKAISELPTPKNGKDYEPMVLKQAVEDAVGEAMRNIPAPQDGKSLTPEDVMPMLKELVTASMPVLPDIKSLVGDAIAAIPPTQPAKDGENGRDALALELFPFIDETKSYPRGSYATHNGGMWRSYEKTHGMRGWECVVDGVAGVDVTQAGQRCFTLTVNRASGACETKTFDLRVMLYRGVFKSGDEYLPGDTVTWGGSLWHCDEKTLGKPGEAGSTCWTLATKRGRDGRDKT